MIALFKLIWCGLVGLFRSRASLEIEILALRHQLNILRRKSPKRPILGRIDRLVLVGLYGLAPDVLSALAIVRPDTARCSHEHPVVDPHVSHFMHVPLRTRVKLPHSPHISPS